MIVSVSIFTLSLACVYLLWRLKGSLDAGPPGSLIYYWDENALLKAVNILDGINSVAGGSTLTAERARHLNSFGGHCILVYGQIGQIGAGDCGPEWATRQSYFIIAPTHSVHAIADTSPDFDPLFKTPEFSIFTLSDKMAQRLP